ncbi:MAG: GTPase Era [Balneola sp.]|jgi:GTP-binding protein Era|nr:GTPase Era [Balneola sp.]MBE80719.1 GTPase Era [Balneola sp.]HBX65031.1 GTPase Era [Balneolaceae bacterium]|tara:strand:- start:17456 stop:18337 length:882 start_codon:yes stop_codon:yes gene_type:complete
MENKPHKSGYVAIIGKPNAGKSTLMNNILGSKISITTHKAQTTRHQIVGIFSDEDTQIVFLDTPGVISPKYELQKAMMKTVERARSDADLILFIHDPMDTHPPDDVVNLIKSINKPIYLVVNKMDAANQEKAEKSVADLEAKMKIRSVHYISATMGTGVEELMEEVKKGLLPGPPFYPKEDLSEHPVRFFVSELIREQIFLQFHQEIPYSCTVEVISYDEDVDIDRIHADIIVNQKSQKGMLIGKGGSAIKELGIEARKSVEGFIGKQVYLELHVKVREKWREKEGWVRNLGY